MSWWSRTCVVLLSAFYLQQFIRVTCAQRFELEVLLTRYESGNRIPDQLFLRACLREASTSACNSACTMEESQDVTLTDSFSSPTTIPITFGNLDTMGDRQIMCGNIRGEVDSDSFLTFNSQEISITMTGGPVEQFYRRQVSSNRDRIELDYTYQVVCAENYFGPSCSTSCTQTGGSSVSFTCVGANGEEMSCPPINLNCNDECDPDLDNCQPIETATTGQTTSSNTDDDDDDDTAQVSEAKVTATTSSVSVTVGNGAEGNSAGLSQGQVAGIVIPLLTIALVVTGVVTGLLVWKYQPQHNTINEAPMKMTQNQVYGITNAGQGVGEKIVSNVAYGIGRGGPQRSSHQSLEDFYDYITQIT